MQQIEMLNSRIVKYYATGQIFSIFHGMKVLCYANLFAIVRLQKSCNASVQTPNTQS